MLVRNALQAVRWHAARSTTTVQLQFVRGMRWSVERERTWLAAAGGADS